MSKRGPKLLLIFFFLVLVFGVPATQALVDVVIDEDRPQVLALFEQPPTEENLRAFEKDLEEYSLFEQSVRPVFQLARYLALGDLGEKALAGEVPGWLFYHPGVRYLTQPYFRLLAQEDDPVLTIADFARQLRARGISLLVVPVPGKASIHPERLVSSVRPRPAIYRHTTRLIGELRQAGVDVVALHPAFVAARRRGAVLYMRSDTHWNGQGVELAARVIARQIRRQPWYRRPAMPRYRRRGVTVVRRGDVPQMTRIPRQQRLFSPERVSCFKVFRQEDGEPYEDSDDAPVLLLGDSFSRVFQTDEPEAAGLIANLAYELQLPLSSIVNDGGASTLVRQELARDLSLLEGKRLVVWAFVERDVRFGLRGWQPVSLE